jgi:dihydrofolate reductase
LEVLEADEGTPEREERFVDVGTPFGADGQTAELREPGQGALDHPAMPVFVVTHSVPEKWVRAHPEASFTFVTEGVERAVALAKEAAGEKNVAVGAASIVQQCLKAGPLDELHVELALVLLGKGGRLFEYLGVEPIELERTMLVEAPDVTHIRFRVLK